VKVPAWGGQPARTVTSNHAVGGNPFVTSVTDPAGTITTTSDILGRTASYTDSLGYTTTSSYGQAGQALSTVGPKKTGGADAGTTTNTYDPANGRLTATNRSGGTFPAAVGATITYDGAGRPKNYTYTNGATTDDIVYDVYGRQSTLAWRKGGVAITSDQVTRSINGDVTNKTADGSVSTRYEYDVAGRLTGAITGANTSTYQFGAAIAGCPDGQANPGVNTNRTRQTTTGRPDTTYCYDNADRLLSYSAKTALITYDSHGNTTSIDGQTMTYDAADRHVSTASAPPATPTTVSYVRDATDRIVARKVNGTVQSQYISSGGGDAPDGALAANGSLTELTTSLPGGALLTVKTAGQTWSLPNIHGDVAATTDGSGAKVGSTFLYDPFGNPLGAIPENSTGDLDYGWLGQHQRPLEHQPGLTPIIEMGARQYHPGLGRFLEVDPVEGGSANDYDYVNGEPINDSDLDGLRSRRSRGRSVSRRGGVRRRGSCIYTNPNGSCWGSSAIPGTKNAKKNFCPFGGNSRGGRGCRGGGVGRWSWSAFWGSRALLFGGPIGLFAYGWFFRKNAATRCAIGAAVGARGGPWGVGLGCYGSMANGWNSDHPR
jgi:RHS repeat-associated protein